MANTLLTIDMITRESIRVLKNELGFAKGVNRQYDDQFANKDAQIGSTINIRKPARYVVSDGATLVNQDVTDESVPLTLDSQKHVGLRFTSKELALSVEEFSKRYISPAMCALANKIDHQGLGVYKQVYNAVGTPGTTPATFKVMIDAGTKLSENATPLDSDRNICFNPAASGEMADALKGLYQSQSQIKKQYEKGLMGLAAGFNIKMDQNIRQHTVGAHGGTPLVNGAAQSGASLITDGWGVGVTTLKEGDVFTIALVYSVNPQSRESTGKLQQFVVTADNADTAGAMTLAISPSISATGAYKNVTALPADNAAITVLGSASTLYPQNIAYHKDAFALGMADLPLPGGVDMAARISDKDSGISMRLIRAYDINSDRFPCRLDVLFGWKTLYPELACRIIG